MTPLEQHLQNDLDGLLWIHKFGWLRSAELGALLWPESPSARHQADRLVRSWQKRRLTLARPLPLRNGRAHVLASAGVRLLREHGVEASSGKSWGDFRGECWMPPSTWKHDLLTAGVLVDLHARGFDIEPEQHVRRFAGSSMKLPDGLAHRDGQVLWIETEMARKSGPYMRALADALCAVAGGTAPPLMGLRPTRALVAFAVDQRDERGHMLSHQQRLSSAVAAAARRAVPLTWAACATHGAGVDAVTYTDDVIQADKAAAIMRRLDAAGWRPETGVIVSQYGARRALVWEDEEADCWAWQVDELPGGRVSTVSEAKRCCAERLAAL